MLAAALTEVLNVLPILAETSRGGEDYCFTRCSCTWESNRIVVSLDLFRKVGGSI